MWMMPLHVNQKSHYDMMMKTDHHKFIFIKKKEESISSQKVKNQPTLPRGGNSPRFSITKDQPILPKGGYSPRFSITKDQPILPKGGYSPRFSITKDQPILPRGGNSPRFSITKDQPILPLVSVPSCC